MSKAALVRVRELQKVFTPVSDSNFEAIVARLAALYEDMRIELHGIAEDSIPSLDQLDVRYRRIYFLRKSLATLREFAEAIRHLQACPEFGRVEAEFTPELHRYWRKASAFFKRNEETLRLVRNDIGGHFGLEASRFALQNLHSDAANGIELAKPDAKDNRMFLRFSGEVVATAMLRHARGVSRDHQIKRLITVARLGYRHATRCVHSVVACYLWERFGK